MIKVSIITPAYNAALYLPEAIESVLNQTYKDFEHIIVNDGSNDGTEGVVRKYQHIQPEKIIYLERDNGGHAAARNTGIRAARGEFIAFLDADDVWMPEKLSEQLSTFASNDDIGLVHANVYGFGGPSGTYVNRNWMSPEQISRHSGHIFFEHYFRTIRITTSTVMVRKKCLDDVGLFDEHLSRLGSEDRELFLRILRTYKAVYIHKPLAKYRDRQDSAGQEFKKMFGGQQYVYEKISSLYKIPDSDKRRALSSVCYEWASSLYDSYCFREGFVMQIKSVGYSPFTIKPYALILKMLKKASIRAIVKEHEHANIP